MCPGGMRNMRKFRTFCNLGQKKEEKKARLKKDVPADRAAPRRHGQVLARSVRQAEPKAAGYVASLVLAQWLGFGLGCGWAGAGRHGQVLA